MDIEHHRRPQPPLRPIVARSLAVAALVGLINTGTGWAVIFWAAPFGFGEPLTARMLGGAALVAARRPRLYARRRRPAPGNRAGGHGARGRA